jgi:hypothetical protein
MSFEKLKWKDSIISFFAPAKKEQKSYQKRIAPLVFIRGHVSCFFVLMRKVGSPRTPQFNPWVLTKNTVFNYPFVVIMRCLLQNKSHY